MVYLFCCLLQKRPSAGPSAGPSRSQERKIAKKLRNKALKAACKAAEQAIDLAGNAAEPSQVSLLYQLAEQNPCQEQLGSILDCFPHALVVQNLGLWPLRLTSLSLPLLLTTATGFVHCKQVSTASLSFKLLSCHL